MTENDTFEKLRKHPIDDALLNRLFPYTIFIDEATIQQKTEIVESIHSAGWKVWEFYVAVGKFLNQVTFGLNEPFMIDLLRIQKDLGIEEVINN